MKTLTALNGILYFKLTVANMEIPCIECLLSRLIIRNEMKKPLCLMKLILVLLVVFFVFKNKKSGNQGGTRTHNLQIRSLLRYHCATRLNILFSVFFDYYL